jgi:uncharacterized protein YwqG
MSGRGWVAIAVLTLGAVLAGRAMRRARSRPSPAPAAPPTASARGWREVLADPKLSPYAAALQGLLRGAIRVDATPVALDRLKVGASRLGGVPDLPPDLAWPTFRGKSLAFIAEIDLAEVSATAKDELLPADGTLWFFYSVDEPWGFDPKDQGGSVVAYRPPGPRVRRPPPADLPDAARFSPLALGFARYFDLPDLSDERNPVGADDDAVAELYENARTELAGWRSSFSHKLLGYPQTIQGPMELECALATQGIYVGDAKGYHDPRARALEKDQYDWRLLLQVDSDDGAHMMWGDAGMLYFWIRQDDLRARRFDKAWLILQCG